MRSVATLRDWGVALILDPARLPAPGSQEPAPFPWDELRAVLPSLRAHRAAPPA